MPVSFTLAEKIITGVEQRRMGTATTRRCEAGTIAKTANWSGSKRKELQVSVWVCRSCRKCVLQILNQQALRRGAAFHISLSKAKKESGSIKCK